MNEIDVSNNSLGDWQVSSRSHHNCITAPLNYDLMALYKSVYCYCYYYNCEQRYFAFVPRNAMLASAVFAVVVCPSVCLFVCPSVRSSQAGIVSKRLDESNWILVRRLPFTYPTLCYKQIWVSPRFGYLF